MAKLKKIPAALKKLAVAYDAEIKISTWRGYDGYEISFPDGKVLKVLPGTMLLRKGTENLGKKSGFQYELYEKNKLKKGGFFQGTLPKFIDFVRGK